jgi:adenylate cyclase
MGLKDDLIGDVNGVLNQEWNTRDGILVPESEDVALAGGAVKLDATILYADLADSTELAMTYDRRVAAKVYKSFLSCASRIIKQQGGHIRSFDGDRVMGIFIGDSKNTNAVKCALMINWTFLKVIKPKLESKYPSLKDGTYQLAHCVGVDTSEVLVVRGGIRNNNDLVWIGRAPNVAAKLSNIRQSPHHTYITADVYRRLEDSAKMGGSPKRSMWEQCSWTKVPGVPTVYRSNFWWEPS